MKKCAIFLCCTFLLGLTLLWNTEGELPLFVIRPILRICSIQTSKVVIKDHCLTLFDVKIVRKNVEFRCPKLWLRFKKSGIICHVNQAVLKQRPHEFFNICGIIKKHHGCYNAFLELENKNVAHIRMVCDAFSPKTFQKLIDILHPSKASAGNFSASDLRVHISGKNVHYRLDNVTINHMHAVGCHGELYIDGAWLKYSQKTDLVQYQDSSLAPVHCNGILNLRYLKLQKAFLQMQTHHAYLGSTTIAVGARNVCLSKQIPAYFQLQSDALYAEGKFSDVKHLELDKGFAKCTSSDLLEHLEWLQPFHLAFQRPSYLRLYGNKQHFSGVFDTTRTTLGAIHFHHIHSLFEIENWGNFSWDAKIYADKMHPRISGFYNVQQDLGKLRCAGHVAPELTYAFKSYLPDWWKPFFEDFQFAKSYPYTDFSVSFKVQEPYALCFGYVSTKDAHFKRSHIQQLHMNFGNCPGYCWLRINDLKMHQQHGACEIHWPYSITNSPKERWIFNGNGSFRARDWVYLLEDFIGENEKFEILKRFEANAKAQATFEGLISSEPDEKEHLAVDLKMPKGKVWDLPVNNFSADYIWDVHSTQIKNIQAHLLDKSPIVAEVSLQKEHFNFQFKGQQITTQPLLKHPLLQAWTKAIPKDNLKNYDGILDLNLQAQGKYLDSVTLSGHGHLKFQNPNLSQVHILGPLTRLFSKKFKWLPVVSFDQLISDFNFTEKQISTQKSTLLGPSTRATLQGHIDLPQQKILGEIHFSFLDYQQLNFPVMKHFMQIFQPISKGFSAKISGTFSDPHWRLSFNPLRFILPKK